MHGTCLFVVAVLIVSVGQALAAGDVGPLVHPAANTDPEPGPSGAPPYEMAGRVEERTPLLDFQNVDGWLVEAQDAEGWLVRSEECKLYQRPFVGKLTYVGRGKDPALTVRPPQPIVIPEPWDCINFWNWGNTWCWVNDPSTPSLNVTVLLRDAQGRGLEIHLGSMNYTYWFMMHGQLSSAQRTSIARPVSFAGFRFSNARNTEKRTVFLGPCTFYKEDLKPLSFEPWPEKLPFPTRPETILPLQKLAQFENTVSQSGDVTAFRYHGADAEIAFTIRPERGGLADIEVVYGGKTIRPCAGGGVALVTSDGIIPPGDARQKLIFKSQQLSGKMLTAVWRLEAPGVATDVTWRYQMRQKSLVVDVEADAPVLERLAWGRAETVTGAKIFRIPYLTYGSEADPHALYANGLFFFAQCDWFVSNASVLDGGGRLGSGWAVFNGGARYIPKTDGQRNLLRERLFVTASPDFQEVLPTIPNPPSPWREVQGERLWRTKMGDNHQAEIDEAKWWRNRGCDKMTVRYHEDSWRDAGESFTFRTAAAPGRGGDEALKRFVAAIQALGWRVGLYTNYTDYAPVNAMWNEDWVSRSPDGSWMGAWCRCYAPKPMRAVEAEARLAPQIQAKFGENHSYCDVHTAVSPFSRVDYDARVPGAGTFRRTFECFGRLLYNEKSAHNGPVYSEGNNHWWYAGLVDGNYAQVQLPLTASERLLVDFDLLKMHPLCLDADVIFRGGGWASGDRYLACTVAYGHIGQTGSVEQYYMLQQTQKRYAMIPVRRIAYEDGGQWLDTSQALIAGAHRNGRLRIEYENGTEVTVNGSAAAWNVQCGDRRFELPQWGFVVRRPEDGLLTYNASVFAVGPDGQSGPQRQVKCSIGTEQFYVNSAGGFSFLDKLGAEGAAALKKDWGGWWVIPIPECADFAFAPELAGLDATRDVELKGIKEDGSPDSSAALRWSRGLIHIVGAAKECLRVQVVPTSQAAPPALGCKKTTAVAGESVSIEVPAALKTGVSDAGWEAGKRTWPAQAAVTGDRVACTVPADAKPGEHLWLRLACEGQASALWLDFIAADPIELGLTAPSDVLLNDGDTLPLTLEVRNNLERPVELPASLAATPDARCEPATIALKVEAAAAAVAAFRLALPWREGKTTVTAQVRTPAGERAVSRSLAATWGVSTLVDLAATTAARTVGFCARGKPEVTLTEEGAHPDDGAFIPATMTSGTVEKSCLFSHPPYGRNRAGYAFAVYEIALPKTPAARFDCFIGMRSVGGIDPTDGVTFKVVVTDAGGQQHDTFSEHYPTREWKPVSVDLAPFAGETIRLKLIADCGPKDDTCADHALWGEPRVVLDAKQLRVQVTE